MRKLLLSLLCFAMATTSLAQETALKRTARRGEAAGYTTRDASVLSMVGWGVGLAIGIAALCALFDQDTGGGGNAHAHS